MTDMDDEELKNTIQTELTDQLGERAMTVAERLRIKGMQQGMQQGIEQGIEQGMQAGTQTGRQESRIEIAQRLLIEGADIAFVVKITQLSEAEVIQLKEQVS